MLNKYFNRIYLFREIYENNPKVNNLKFSVKLSRLLIRFFVLNFSYSTSIIILKFLNFTLLYLKLNKINNTTKYITYLLTINYLYLDFVNNLKKFKVQDAFIIKKKLANFILNNSFSYQHRTDARQYLKVFEGNYLISKHLNQFF